MLHFDSSSPYNTQTPDKSSTSGSKVIYEKAGSKASGRWTKEEHQKFIEGLKKFGKNWKQVEEYVGTRNGAQIRSHAQKFFNRLEREFNLKFEDLNLKADKKKLEETLRKISESSIHTQDNEFQEVKLSDKVSKDLSPIAEAPCKFETFAQASVQSAALSLSNSPKLNHFEYPNFAKKPVRKMSEDILHTRPYSFFDLILSKIKTCNNKIASPKLSDLVDMTSSTRSSFDTNDLKPNTIKPAVENEQHFSNSSFKLHPRKISEDNVLINLKLNQLRRREENNFADVELITKKYKVN